MGWWDNITDYFSGGNGGGIDIDLEGRYEVYGHEVEPAPESFIDLEGRYEVYGHEVEGDPWYGSLWGAFKEAGTQLVKSPLLPAIFRGDKGGLQANFPRLGMTPDYDRMDAQLYTPYPRKTTGSIPAPPAPRGGISPIILLIGAGAVVFLVMRRK